MICMLGKTRHSESHRGRSKQIINRKAKDKLTVTQKLSEKAPPGIQGLFALKDRMTETRMQPLEPEKVKLGCRSTF